MSMTQESDSSEEFYDAEDQTPKANGKKKSPKILSTAVTKDDGFKFPKEAIKKPGVQEQSKVYQSQPNLAKISTDDIMEFVEPKPMGRQRFRDIRQTMQHEDDENIGNTLTPESQNSSSEGVYPQRTIHKFRIIEHDTASIQSMTSLGRVGRILAGNIDPSAISVGRESVNLLTKSSSSQLIQSQVSQTSQLSETDLENQVSNKIDSLSVKTNESVESSASSTTAHQHQQQLVSDTCSASKMNFQDKKIYIEPDVIASTKLAHSKTSDNLVSSRPVVPPRKKRNPKKLSTSSSENFNPNDDLASIGGSNDDNQTDDQPVTTASHKNYNYIVDNSDSEIDSKSVKSKPEQPTPPVTKKETAIEKLQRELENEFSNNENHNVASVSEEIGGSKTYKSASLNRIYNSLGNSTTSINSRPSPSNSAKSNSAPSRVSSIDPTQSLNLYKATRGRYVVKPQDEVTNKAVGPSFDEIERIHAEIFQSTSRDRVNLSGTGTNSLGSGSRYEHFSSLKPKNSKERRKSAGDEDIIKQLNVSVRTRTDSGKQLSDIEILQQVPVKNLDTGENFPLSVIEDKLPELKEKMNPLSFHIMRLTSEVPEMDEEAGVDIPAEVAPADEDENDFEEGSRLKRKTERIRQFFRSTMTKTVDKARSIASEVSHARHKEDVADVVDVVNPEQNIKIKASNTNKGPYEFAKLQHVQDLSGEHTGAVWCMKFSSCGRLLATAGQDKYLRIWVLKDAYPFFQDMRTKYNTDQKSSPTPSQESLVSQSSSTEEAIAMATAAEKSIGPFMPKAFCTYSGHTSDLLDVSWSKNYFILSSSMDKTVRLWHISRKECLCCFQHIDFVTAIAFHPRDDRYFLSGSLDGKLRLWNIPDKKVALWNELDGQTKLITAANFCQNGKFAVVGSYDGRCIFYTTDQLKYHTQIHVRSTRGRNSTGRKISGIEPMPGEDKILVTSNDSRIRLYDLRDLNLSCKYKGYLNASSQIKASFSHDGKYIISGSENQQIYIWKTHHDYAKLSSVRRDRNDFWEGIKAHNATVTCAIFAPHPEAIIKPDPDEMSSEEAQNYTPDPLVEQHKKGCGYVLVSADFSGAIKVFINKTKPKHSSLPYTAILD